MAFGGGQQFSEERPYDRLRAPGGPQRPGTPFGGSASVGHAMGTFPGMDPIARYYAMPGASPWPGDPSQDPGLTQPPSNGLFNQNLLGGNYTTQAALEANPTALANRRAGLQAGFVGGSGSEGWGDGNYRRYTEQQPTMPNPGFPTQPMPMPNPGGSVRLDSDENPGVPPGPGPTSPWRFNQNLLGGNYTTQEALEDNPAALAARRQGLRRGFSGGDDWGDGNYRRWLETPEGQLRPQDEGGKPVRGPSSPGWGVGPLTGLMGNQGFGPGLLQPSWKKDGPRGVPFDKY